METAELEKTEVLDQISKLLHKAKNLGVPVNLNLQKEKPVFKDVKPNFVLMFTQNALEAFLDLSKADQVVLVALTKICSYGNVWQVTHSVIANEAKLARPTVTKSIKTLKEKGYLLKDPDTGMEFINPFLFLKGSMEDFMKTDAFKKMKDGRIKLPNNKDVPFFN